MSVTSCITCIEKELLSGPFWFLYIFYWFLILNLNLIEIEIHYIIELDLKLSVYLFEVFCNKVILFCERTINSKFAGTKICILFLMAPFDTLAIKAAKCNNVYDWLGGQLLCTKKIYPVSTLDKVFSMRALRSIYNQWIRTPSFPLLRSGCQKTYESEGQKQGVLRSRSKKMHLISISLFSRKYYIPLSSTECIIYALDKMARACKDRNNQPTTLETKQQIRASSAKISKEKTMQPNYQQQPSNSPIGMITAVQRWNAMNQSVNRTKWCLFLN